jgi:putative spermidine/putrescine transport system permease protein
MNGARLMPRTIIPRTVIALTMLFLLGPFVVVLLAAMSAGNTLTFPPQGLSLRWFAHVFTVEAFHAGFWLSLWLAVVSTGLALLIGVPAAYALSRYQLPFAESVRRIVTSPLIVPGLIVGLALMQHIVVPLDLPVALALVGSHTILAVPYVLRVVGASLANVRADMEEAAFLLGASRLGAFARVVLPNIRAGVAAAFILGFITSFNQVPVSLFMTGPGVSTLPIQMLGYMEYTFDPSIAALSALLALVSVAIMLAAERALGLSRHM